ncbi:MAG: transposase [Chitinophagales bacterium]|nr:transposase [Chitinophagales bacterium]
MQGHKKFNPQLFYELSLDGLVPQDNFYRKLNRELEFGFLYSKPKNTMVQKVSQNIDPVVFFKILLVGYLNNINSDRALLRYCATLGCAFVYGLRLE